MRSGIGSESVKWLRDCEYGIVVSFFFCYNFSFIILDTLFDLLSI